MVFNKYSLGTNITLLRGRLEYSPICLNEGFVKDQIFTLQSQASFHSLLVQYEMRTADTEKCNLLSSGMISGPEL